MINKTQFIGEICPDSKGRTWNRIYTGNLLTVIGNIASNLCKGAEYVELIISRHKNDLTSVSIQIHDVIRGFAPDDTWSLEELGIHIGISEIRRIRVAVTRQGRWWEQPMNHINLDSGFLESMDEELIFE